MRDYTVLAELDREGFNVIVDKTWEDLPLEDLFDTSINPDTNQPYYDIHKMYADIEMGELDYFMLRVRVMHEDMELAVSYVGGFLYEDATEVLRDGTAEDMIWETVEEAKRRVPTLIQGLSKLVVDKALV
jgi:hypothetical protein